MKKGTEKALDTDNGAVIQYAPMRRSRKATSGIERRWIPGEDDRIWLAKYSGLTPRQTDAALTGLWRLLVSKPRTKFVGWGIFEWKPWRNRIPTGKFVETWRLAFKPSRYSRPKYKGESR